MITAAVISDTHNLLRPTVLEQLAGCDIILHGGDICRQEIVDRLRETAPLYVVRGNNDRDWAEQIPYTLDFTLEGVRFFMTHKKTDIPGRIADYDVIVYGHSHRFAMEQIGGTLFLNPGSCGPRRFRQNITMAILRIENGQILSADRIDLPDYIPAADNRNRTAIEKEIPADIRDRIEKAVRMIKKGKSVTEIAVRLRLDHDLAENICRMYLTHPGVDIDGIMRRLGL